MKFLNHHSPSSDHTYPLLRRWNDAGLDIFNSLSFITGRPGSQDNAELHDHTDAVDEATSAAGAALEQARSMIADHERTLLAAEDRDVVLSALDAPSGPTEALREAMALHEARVARDG